MLMIKGLKIKLKPTFLGMCKAMKKQFQDLIPPNTIEQKFVDFLNEQFYDVKDMNEREFIQYILNIRSEIYPNFLRFKY